MFTFSGNKLSVGKIWQASLLLYKATIAKVWYLALIMMLIMMSRIVVFGFADVPSVQTMSTWNIIYAVITSLIGLLFIGVIFHRMHRLTLDPQADLNTSFTFVLSKYLVLLISMIALYVCVLVGFVVGALLASLITPVLLVPGILFSIFVGILLMFNLPLILFDNRGWFTALKDSAHLVWNNWWRTLFIFIIPAILIGIIQMIVARLTGMHNVWLYFIVVAIVMAFLQPFMCAVVLAQFNDLKLRRS